MTPDELSGAALEAELRRRFVVESDRVPLGGKVIELLRPRSAEDLISEDDFAKDERLPYWAALWPSAIVLAEALLRRADAPSDLLELGCGLGLVSIAAMRAGHRVTASDYYADALRFTRLNAWRVTGVEPETCLLDWRDIPKSRGRFPRIVAADVLYERSYARIVAEALSRLLADRGEAVIADPGRVAAEEFLLACAELGLELGAREERRWSSGTIRQTIRLYSLVRRA